MPIVPIFQGGVPQVGASRTPTTPLRVPSPSVDYARVMQAALEPLKVGVDAAGGKVAVSGWKEVTNIDSLEFCRRLQNMGVRHIIYTDISKDGCLNGTNIAIYKVLCQTLQIDITASGGITYLHELQKLKKMNIYGAIVGKAIYEGKLNLAEAIAAAEGRNVG